MPLSVHLSALGCRLNEAELNTWRNQFQSAGHRIVQDQQPADVYILNSCAVTSEAVRKSRSMLNKLHRQNPSAKIVATGCFATLEPERAADCGVDLVVVNTAKNQLVEKVEQLCAIPNAPASAMAVDASIFAGNRSRAFIKIQDGCRHRCSFCIVTIARGEEVSRPLQEIITEVEQLHRNGCNEIVLTGVHVGGYGSDIDSDLIALVRALLEQTSIPRIRFASVEPWNLGDGFFDLFANPRLMPHMHLPLQSGADSVLKRMARRCKSADFAQLVATARAAAPEFNVTTDIIVGFPGETEAEFASSIEFARSMGFGHIHVFPYSIRENTGAAKMPNHLDKATKKARLHAFEAIAEESRLSIMTAMIGTQTDVLLENRQYENEHGQSLRFGYTHNYLKAEVFTDLPAGDIVRVEIIGLNPEKTALSCRPQH